MTTSDNSILVATPRAGARFEVKKYSLVTTFLDRFFENGTLDSTGEFTISPLKSLEKLGRHAFKRNTDWSVKLLEAAAADPAVEQVRFSRQGVGWSVTLLGSSRSARKLLEATFDTTQGLADPMLSSFRFLLGLRPQLFGIVTIRQGQAELGLCRDGEIHLSRLELPEESNATEIQFSATGLEGSNKELEAALTAAATWLSLPVVFNGKRLDGHLLKSATCAHVPGSEGLPLTRQGAKFVAHARTNKGMRLPEDPADSQHAEAACATLRGPGRLVVSWLSHGIVLKSVTAEFHDAQLIGVASFFNRFLVFAAFLALLTAFTEGPKKGVQEFCSWALSAGLLMTPTVLLNWARSTLLDPPSTEPQIPIPVSVVANPLSTLLGL